MNFLDRATIEDGSLRKTADGYVVAEVPVARTGIQDYAGYEMGKPEMKRVRVYRPADEVFADSHLISIAHKPVTNDHPNEAVSPATWKRDAVGYMGEAIRKDEAAGLIHVPMLFADAGAINALEQGKREVSMGYSCDIDWTAGVTDNGEEYDAVQRNIRANHCALVTKGRAGYSCRVGDNWTPIDDTFNDKEPLVATKQITYDGLPLEVTDAAEAVINKLIAARDSLKTELADAVKETADATAAHDKAMAAKDAEIDALKAAQLSQDAIDALADAKAEVVSQAKAILGDANLETKGKSVADIRRETVKAKLGDAAVADKSDDYIEARFDTLKPAETTDAFREVVKDGVQSAGDTDKAVADARKAYLDSLINPFAKQDA